jgi:acetyltransferase-like isoleucine patch superfamily enzyme
MRNMKYPSANVDVRAQIRPDAQISGGATIGPRVRIGPSCTIGTDTKITGPVTIGRGVYIGERCVLEGPLAIEDFANLQNAIYTKGHAEGTTPKLTTIGMQAFICTGVLLQAGITIGARTMIEGGSRVEEDVPPNTYVAGTPAVFVDFMPR